MADRDFKDVLTDLDEGEVVNQLSALMPKVTKAVMETGKAGALTLSLKITKQGGMAVVTAAIATKMPAPALDSTLFFTQADGTLCRRDPRQQELRGLDDVGTAMREARPLRVVAGARPVEAPPAEPSNDDAPDGGDEEG